jgi:hypothetical protein
MASFVLVHCGFAGGGIWLEVATQAGLPVKRRATWCWSASTSGAMVITSVVVTCPIALHPSSILWGYPGRVTKRAVRERRLWGRWGMTPSMYDLPVVPLAMAI